MNELYFTEQTIVNPTVQQRRCATQVLKRERVEGGTAWTFVYSKDVWRGVQPGTEVAL